jgi:hypothetical protein
LEAVYQELDCIPFASVRLIMSLHHVGSLPPRNLSRCVGAVVGNHDDAKLVSRILEGEAALNRCRYSVFFIVCGYNDKETRSGKFQPPDAWL